MFRNASKVVSHPSKIYRINRTLAIVSPNSIQSLALEMENLRDENSAPLITEYYETKAKISGLFDLPEIFKVLNTKFR